MRYFTSLWRGAGTILEDVPLTEVSYTRKLGGQGAGELTGRLLLTDAAASTARVQALLDATRPWVCACWAEDDTGQLRWGGPIISRPYSSGQGYLEVKAGEPGAYFGRRTIPTSRTLVATEQLSIQRTLYADAMALPGGDVRVVLGADTSGVVRDRTYVAAQRKGVEDASRELSNVLNGFDYAWQPEYNGGSPQVRLLQGYPTLGGAQQAELQFPGDVLAYAFPEEGGAMATLAWAVGKQDQAANTTPQAQATATSLLDQGYPLLEQVQSYTDVSDAPTLQAHADADLVAQAGPLTNVQVDLSLADLLASGIALGNVVRLRIEDTRRFPGGADLGLRVVAITERPQQGTATLTVADRVLTGGRLPSERGAAELLAGLSRRVLNVETI